MKKKNKLVVVLYYKGDVLAVCSTMSKAHEVAKRHIFELDYKVNYFHFDLLPLV